MTSEWREELQTDPKVVELRGLLWAKWRVLGRDKEFVQETSRLRTRLDQAFATDPVSVRQFFSQYSLAIGSRLQKIHLFLNGIKSKDVRSTLRRYVRYVNRFGVTVYYRKKAPHFRMQAIPPWGTKFHAKVFKGHLRPAIDRGGAYIYQFEKQSLETPAPLEELIKTGEARTVRIDDREGSSVLTEIEAFAYHPEGLTFIMHRAEMPYIICLVGEKASSKTWRAAERTIHILQRQFYGRVNAGRPASMGKNLKVAAALRRAGPSKEKAITALGDTHNPESSQSAFSLLKSKLT